MDRFSNRLSTAYLCIVLTTCLLYTQNAYSQLVISEIAPNAEVEALEQYGGGEWFEVCNVGQTDMDISGYTIGHYEDASFGQSDYFLGFNNDNCDCGGSYGVIKFIGGNDSGDVILPSGKCLIITGMDVDCGNSTFCINARDLMLNGPSGIVAEYNSSRSDYPGLGNGSGRGALEGHYWRQKNYECNAYFLWNDEDVIIDAVNFNCLPQTGPDIEANQRSGGFHYPDGQGGYYSYPPAFPTPPASGPFPVGIEITNNDFTWVGESIEEGFTFQRCSNDPNFVFPPMRYDPMTGLPTTNYYMPTCGEMNDDCCSDCDNNEFFQGVQLPNCTNGSTVGLVIEEDEITAENEVLSAVAPSCNNNETRLRSNYNDNEISFCTLIESPNQLLKPFVGFVNSLDESINLDDCAVFTGATIYESSDCELSAVPAKLSTKGRAVFAMQTSTEYTLCFDYNLSDCNFKNRIYWDNPCFSPFYCALDVVCPDVIRDTVSCLELVPAAVTDSLNFINQLGGSILSSCSSVTISHVDSIGNRTDPKNKYTLYRKYLLTDDIDSVYCTLEYPIINYIPPTLVLNTDTVYLAADGTLDLFPGMFIAQAYDTCGDTVETDSISPLSIDGSDLGDLEIIVTVVDSANNVTKDTIDVVVADNTPPSIICPNDTILIVPPCVCESPYIFNTPDVFDELGNPVTIVQIDTSGLVSGDLFPAGITTIIYEATDQSGNTSICTYDVEVISGDPGPIQLKSQLNFSLSETCGGYPTGLMFILGTPACGPDSYLVDIFDTNGDRIDNDSLSLYRNQVLEVEVSYACFNFSGSTSILIEDKSPPQLGCFSDTLACDEFFEIGLPSVTDNCDGEVELILLNETIQNVSCIDPNLSRIVIRTYTAIDDDGRRSDTCFQTLSIAKFDLTTVGFQGIDTSIYCGDIDQYDDNGAPSPAITGFPVAGTTSLWPDQNAICGVTATYEDINIPGTSCGYSIVRMWSVMYWDCFQDGMRQFTQTINIVDDRGPVFTCPTSITIDTEPFSCQASIAMDLPIATDGCNNGVSFDVDYPNSYIANASSIQQTLGEGVHTISLIARDDCGNPTTCSFTVTVEDNEDPIAIVQGNYTVMLSDSTTTVDASDLDKNSFDECGPVTVDIARMTTDCDSSDLLFSPEITICCSDVGTDVMVMFQVTDLSGNTSLAMIPVSVIDNTAPVLIAGLPDITVSCDFPYLLGETSVFGSVAMDLVSRDTILLTSDSSVFSGPALDALISENCGMIVTEEVNTENLDLQCGLGSIIRMFTVSDNSGNSIQFQQEITFFNPSPLNVNDIVWPADEFVYNVCDPADLEPLDSDGPVINSDDCDNAAAGHLDAINYGPFASDTLFVIEREWIVSDWCQNNNGIFFTVDSVQTIVSLDNLEPTLSGCTDIVECNLSPTCEDIVIDLEVSAMDQCHTIAELLFSYEIDFGSDMSVDQSGNGNTSSVAYPLGIHLVKWTVIDPQGNHDVCFQTITINNCNLPSPVCQLDQSFALEGVDTDGMGGVDDEQVTVFVSDIDGGTSNACGTPFTLSFSTDTTITELLFDCNDLGTQIVRLYVTDQMTGIQDFCEVPIEVIDINSVNICNPPSPSMLVISGMITSELNHPTNGVAMSLEGADLESVSDDGFYTFGEMQGGGAYTVRPDFDTYPLDGVSTYDLVQIQKHLLGIKLLDSPYKLLAADVNGSGHISGTDIISIRRVLLGAASKYPSEKNWLFVDKDYEFIDEQNPWLDEIGSYSIDKFTEDMDIDFIAIKAGDVNNSSPNLNDQTAEVRSAASLEYEVLEADGQVILPIYIEDIADVEGFQFSFRYNHAAYDFHSFSPGSIDISEGFYSDADRDLGVIDLSWTVFQNNGTYVQKEDEAAFYIVLENRQRMESLENLGLEVFSEGIAAQIYYADDQIKSLNFKERENLENGIQLFQNKPNPWNNTTLLSFYIPTSQEAQLVISDVTGRVIYTHTSLFEAGLNEIQIDKEMLTTAGIYYYSLKTGTFQNMKKMILIE